MAKVEHKESHMKTECSLSTPLLSLFALCVCVSLSLSLWAGRVRLYARYQNKQRWGWNNGVHTMYQRGEDERVKNKRKSNAGKRATPGNCFYRRTPTSIGELYHFNALKVCHITTHQYMRLKKKNPIAVHIRLHRVHTEYIFLKGLKRKKERQRLSKGCNRIVMLRHCIRIGKTVKSPSRLLAVRQGFYYYQLCLFMSLEVWIHSVTSGETFQ